LWALGETDCGRERCSQERQILLSLEYCLVLISDNLVSRPVG
ncbi:16481_t:CDS:1, partial [Dentiscutata erythropus]